MTGPGAGDNLVFHASIVDAVRHGLDYYPATAEALRSAEPGTRSIASFRLPALTVIAAYLPESVLAAMLYALAAAVLYAWTTRLTPAFRRPSLRFAALLLLAAGAIRFVDLDFIVLHEVWAGLLIALSLAVRRPGRWIEAVALGLAAILIREAAVPYVAVMALFAWAEGERREALGWAIALAVSAVAIGAHLAAVADVAGPLASLATGAALEGSGFVRSIAAATALSFVPLAVAAPIVALALFGWAAWRDALALRMAAIVCAYVALVGLLAPADAWHWALLVAAPFLAGLLFVPDALRDLVRAALDKRRAVVTQAAQ